MLAVYGSAPGVGLVFYDIFTNTIKGSIPYNGDLTYAAIIPSQNTDEILISGEPDVKGSAFSNLLNLYSIASLKKINTINNTKDTCKTTSAILYPYNGSSQLALQLIREPYYNTTGPATFKYYKYIIGDKGFYQIEYTNIDGYLGFSTTTEYKTTLIKTNF